MNSQETSSDDDDDVEGPGSNNSVRPDTPQLANADGVNQGFHLPFIDVDDDNDNSLGYVSETGTHLSYSSSVSFSENKLVNSDLWKKYRNSSVAKVQKFM